MTYFGLFKREWRFLLFGLTLTAMSGFGQTYFISLFNNDIRADFDLSHADFGSLYAIATLASAFSIAWIGKLIDHIDLRIFCAAVCIGLAIACSTMATAHNVIWVGVALFLIRFFGQGMMSHTSNTSMTRYLDANRGKAMGLTSMGYRFSEMALPIPALALAGLIGWQNAWFGFSGFLLVIVLPLSLWLLRGHSLRHDEYLKLMDKAEKDTKTNTATNKGRQWTRGEVLKDWRFYILLPCITCSAFLITGVFFHQQAMVAEKGWSEVYFASLFTLYAICGVITTLTSGSVVDKIGSLRIMPFYLLPMAIGFVVLGTTNAPIAGAAFMVLAGLSIGVASTTYGALWPEVYGTKHLGSIRSMLMSIAVFSTACSPPLFGFLIDKGISFNTINIAGAIYTLVCAILAAVAAHHYRKE